MGNNSGKVNCFWHQAVGLGFSHHLFRNKHFEGIDKGIQHTLTDVILPDID